MSACVLCSNDILTQKDMSTLNLHVLPLKWTPTKKKKKTNVKILIRSLVRLLNFKITYYSIVEKLLRIEYLLDNF